MVLFVVQTDVAILGGRRVKLPVGWTKQRVVSVLGGAEIDAGATPGEGATLRIVSVLAGAKVVVPEGANVSLGGIAILGGRKVDVSPRGGRAANPNRRPFASGRLARHRSSLDARARETFCALARLGE
jgi:hypothetical protein